ncbi:MAG: PAS domain S-box protein [Sediminibacterium sp.]
MQRRSEKLLVSTLLLAFVGSFTLIVISFHTTVNSRFVLLSIASATIFILGLLMIRKYLQFRAKQRMETEYIAKLIGNVQDAIISADENFIIKSWNKGAEAIYGWTASEVIGKKIDIVLPTEFGEKGLEMIREDFTRDGYFNQELVRKTKAGKQINVLVTSSALYSEDGKLSGSVSVNKNITESKRLQEQLIEANRALEEKIVVKTSELHNVFERITDAFLALDKNWCFTYMNKKAAEIVGDEAAAMIGKNIWDVVDIDGEKESDPFYTALHRAMNEQENVNVEVFYPPLQRWFENNIYSSQEGLSIFFRDITDKKIAEKNIQDSEEKRRLIMNAALDAIICIDTTGRITFWNPQAEKIFGWKDSEVNGHLLSTIIIPEPFRKRHDQGMITYLKTGHGPALNVLLELSAINRQGKEFPIELTVLPIKQGNEEFFCAFIRDITKRKRDSEIIRISNERNNMVSKASNDCIWDWDLVTKEVVRDDKKLETMYGYKAWESYEVDTNWNKYAHQEDWKKVTQKRNAILADTQQNYWEDEYRFLKSDGEYGFVTDRGYIIRDANGRAIRMIGASNDISERKKAEQALINSELRFRSLIEKGTEIIAMHDKEGKIIYISPSIHKILGYTAESRIGKFGLDLVHPDDVSRIKNILSNLAANPGSAANAQWRHQHADGSWHWMEGVATNLLHDPAVQAIVHNFRDISDREKIESELVEKNTELQELSAYLQHVREGERKYIAREVHDELGQLVSAVKIDLDWLGIKVAPLEEAAKKRMDHATKTIEVLIASIRKIASSLRPSILDDFGLNAAIQWQCREMQNLNAITCTFTPGFDDSDLKVEVKTELFRIIQESLTNVMRHSNAKNVAVEITEDDENIFVNITDDGNGFDTTVKKNTLGLIGLRERAVSLNGQLSIQSQIGEGTTVTAIIPKNKIQ